MNLITSETDFSKIQRGEFPFKIRWALDVIYPTNSNAMYECEVSHGEVSAIREFTVPNQAAMFQLVSDTCHAIQRYIAATETYTNDTTWDVNDAVYFMNILLNYNMR